MARVSIARYKKRFWGIYSPDGTLICVCVYKKGAACVARLLEAKQPYVSQPVVAKRSQMS